MRLRRQRTGAILSLEFLLLLPILMFLVIGIVEFALMFAVNQQLAVASREGARVAAQGGTPAEIQAAALLNLGQGTLAPNATVTALVMDASQYPNLVPSGQAVAVQVTIADASTVIPNLLAGVGVSLKNKALSGMTVMRVE